jgi:hypothetical protein
VQCRVSEDACAAVCGTGVQRWATARQLPLVINAYGG